MDSLDLDVNDICKRLISLQKHLYLICQAKLIRDPKITSIHSLRSPASDLQQKFRPFLHFSQEQMAMRSFIGIYSSFL